MGEDKGRGMSREERLAAKLRENLKRRKAQGRAIANATDDSDAEELPKKPDES